MKNKIIFTHVKNDTEVASYMLSTAINNFIHSTASRRCRAYNISTLAPAMADAAAWTNHVQKCLHARNSENNSCH